MATELTQVSIGRSSVAHREGPHGLPLRDVVPTKDRELLEPWLDARPDRLDGEQGRPVPLRRTRLLMAQAQTGFELETQTLSLFERELFTEPALPPSGT